MIFRLSQAERIAYFHLRFAQIQHAGQVEAFVTDHVLLPFEFGLQSFELLVGEDRAQTLGLDSLVRSTGRGDFRLAAIGMFGLEGRRWIVTRTVFGIVHVARVHRWLENRGDVERGLLHATRWAFRTRSRTRGMCLGTMKIHRTDLFCRR